MTTDAPDPLAATCEAIADRTAPLIPIGPPGEPASGVAVLAAVAEGFRTAELAHDRSDEDMARWGALQLRDSLGRGTFGEVHLAWDPALQRDVALKLRLPEAGVLRWLDEARALARVRHPNVVVVHGADLRDGRAGIWMERLEGRTLEERLVERGPMAADDVLKIGVQLASALEAVHAMGILHGDVKAANVVLEQRPGTEPRAVLMDFGAVLEARGEDPLANPFVTGTPLASPPEVLSGEAPTPRADVYALGVLLFRLLTARWPYEARTLSELRDAQSSERRATLTSLRRGLPAGLVRAIERAADPDCAKRTASAHELLRELRAIAEPGRVWLQRLAWGAALVSVIVVSVAGVMWLRRPAGDLSLRLRPLPALADTAWASLVWSAEGANANAQLGWLAESLGDLDADGFADVAVNEPAYTGREIEAGRARVYRGSPTGLGDRPAWSASGNQPGAGFSSTLARAGDVNGDGHPDLIVSERYVRDEAGRVGALHLYAGDGATLEQRPSWTWRSGTREMWGLGDGLAGGFDVNGDGYDDVLAGETLHTGEYVHEGIVRLFLGGPTGLATAPFWSHRGGRSDAQLGWRCASAGDVDGDGYDDLLLGAPHWSESRPDAGQVRLFRGGPRGPATMPDWTWTGEGDRVLAGMALAGGGDVDGDGYDDVLLSEGGHSSSGLLSRGRVLWFRGGPRGLAARPAWEWRGPSTSARLGQSGLLLRDLDLDGFADVVAGATMYQTRAKQRYPGLVVVFRGGPRGPSREPDWYRIGREENSIFGGSLGFAGDTDGDGRAELLIGAPAAGARGSLVGRVELLRVKRAAPR